MKKIGILLFLLVFPGLSMADMPTSIDVSAFSGGTDMITPDKMDAKYSTYDGIMNIRTDDGGQLTLRNGTAKDNPTALTGSLKIRNGYNYKQIDGDEYKVWASSQGVFAGTGASYETLIGTLSASYTPDFATAQGNLWISNGFDWPMTWDGATLTTYDTTNSTGMVKARIIEWAWQRMWYTGITGERNRVYFSEALDPAYIVSLENFIDIAPDDGDYITGLLLSGDVIIVSKTHSTWAIYKMNSGAFNYRQVNPTVGCLYPTCLINFRGLPATFSHRGIEVFSESWEPISSPIDTFFQSLNEVNLGTGILEDNTAADWGAGTAFVNVDTNTYSGSVAVSSRTIYFEQTTAEDWGLGSSVNIDTTTTSGSFTGDYTKNDLVLFSTSVSALDSRSPYTPSLAVDGDDSTFWVSGGWLSGIPPSNPHTHDEWIKVDMGMAYSSTTVRVLGECGKGGSGYPPVYLKTDLQGSNDDSSWANIYTLQEYHAGTPSSFDKTIVVPDSYRYLRIYGTYVADNITLRVYSFSVDKSTDHVFTTQALDFGYNPSTWGALNSECSTPTGTSIAFQTRTSTDNINWTAYSSASTGTVIPSLSGRYLQVKSILTGTTSGLLLSPTVNNITVLAEDRGAFTSQTKNAGTDWGSWGRFVADETVPAGSDIDYYVLCSTYSAGMSAASYVTLTNGSQINSTVGPYCWVVSSFTRTSVSAIPKLNKYDIEYYGSNDNYPQMIDYEDSLYVSASTSTDLRNCVVMVYQKDNTWTKYDWDVGAWAINKGNLYYGSSQDDGQIYSAEIDDIYTDNGVEYEGTWTSKYLYAHPYLRTLFTDLWVIGEPLDSVVNFDYRTDGSDGDWTTLTSTFTATNAQYYGKMPLNEAKSARSVQLRVRSSDNFRLNRMYLNYFPVLKNE